MQVEAGARIVTDSRLFAELGSLAFGERFAVAAGTGVLGAAPGAGDTFTVDGSFSRIVVSRAAFTPLAPAAAGWCRVATDARIAGGGSVVRGAAAELRVTDALGAAVAWAPLLVDGVRMTADGEGRLILPEVWQDTVVTLFDPGSTTAAVCRGRARGPAMEGLYKLPEMRNITVQEITK